MSLVILVTHLWGIGHLSRMSAIAAAARARGLAVTLLSGGMPVQGLVPAGVDLVQLPPLRAADADFSALLTETGAPLDEARLTARATLIAATIARVRPRVVLLEHYPFGRRALAREFEAAIDAARALRPPARVVTSVRDILVTPGRPGTHDAVATIIRTRIDDVLVHTDPAVVAFEETFPPARAIADRLHMTGYVVRPAGAPVQSGEILVSCGGASGRPLAEAALAAAGANPPWRVVAGPAMADADWRALLGRAGRAILERSRADLPARIAGAAVAVARAGYNTALEALAAGTPLVLVPFVTPKETEQQRRAEGLAARGWAIHLPEPDLSPASLADAVARAAARGRQTVDVDLEGAVASADLLVRWAEA